MKGALVVIACLLAAAAALDNGLGRTPQMGFNTWNHFGCGINEKLIHDTLDVMVSSGIRDAGYTFCNLDDCWQASRDTQKVIVPDPKTFPNGIKPLVDYAHSKGLKFGLYSDAGFKTCAGRPGSLGYEEIDAKTYAEWGVDYLKYDNCNTDGSPEMKRYPVMRDALNKTGRPIFFSMCEWGNANPAVWSMAVGNSWRTTGDISDNWASMIKNLDLNDNWFYYPGPGGFNDPDMLEIGNGGLNDNEEEAHMALWCLIKSPLLIGCDVTHVKNTSLALLLNREAIAINQDKLGIQGHRVWSDGQDWLKSEIVVEKCDPARVDQKWNYNKTDSRFYAYDNRVLDIADCSQTIKGDAIIAYPAHDTVSFKANKDCKGINQKWTIESDGKIVSKMDAYCMDVWDFIGPNVQAYPCLGTTNQKWSVNADHTIRVAGGDDGRCLSISKHVVPGTHEVWAGPLENGDVAVVLFNRDTKEAAITAAWKYVGLKGPAKARDLLAHKDVGTFTDQYTATIKPHGVQFLRFTPTH